MINQRFVKLNLYSRHDDCPADDVLRPIGVCLNAKSSYRVSHEPHTGRIGQIAAAAQGDTDALTCWEVLALIQRDAGFQRCRIFEATLAGDDNAKQCGPCCELIYNLGVSPDYRVVLSRDGLVIDVVLKKSRY